MKDHLFNRHQIRVKLTDKFDEKMGKLTDNHSSGYEDILLVFLER